jgi:hypothetical protein
MEVGEKDIGCPGNKVGNSGKINTFGQPQIAQGKDLQYSFRAGKMRKYKHA